MAKRICSISGCDDLHEARGWCAKHYLRWKKYGDPLGLFGLAEPDLPSERWLPVPGFEGYYEVSDQGRARSLDRTVTITDRWGGTCQRPHRGRVLKAAPSSYSGYRVVTFSLPGKTLKIPLHRVVAAVFIGPRPPGQEVRHGPNGKLDNRASQLCYGTKVQQKEDMIRDGTVTRGEALPQAKLTAAIVAECRRRYAAGEAQAAMAREFGVSVSSMNLAIRGKTWRSVA
jgi:hypothetical protein